MPGVIFDQSLLYLYICNSLILVELKDEEPEGAERPQKLSLRAWKMRRGREGCAGGTKAPWKVNLRAVCSATWEPALQDRKNMCKGPGRQGWWLVFTGAAERVRGRVQRRQGTAEIPAQREEENVKRKEDFWL